MEREELKGSHFREASVWLEADSSIYGRNGALLGSGSHGSLVSRSRATSELTSQAVSGSSKSTDGWEGEELARI